MRGSAGWPLSAGSTGIGVPASQAVMAPTASVAASSSSLRMALAFSVQQHVVRPGGAVGRLGKVEAELVVQLKAAVRADIDQPHGVARAVVDGADRGVGGVPVHSFETRLCAYAAIGIGPI